MEKRCWRWFGAWDDRHADRCHHILYRSNAFLIFFPCSNWNIVVYVDFTNFFDFFLTLWCCIGGRKKEIHAVFFWAEICLCEWKNNIIIICGNSVEISYHLKLLFFLFFLNILSKFFQKFHVFLIFFNGLRWQIISIVFRNCKTILKNK